MQPADTSLGGQRGAFPDTQWSLVARLGASATHEYRSGLEALCSLYWKPVYVYVRIAWAKSNEDAKDLAQAFFLWLAEGEPLRKYAPERGGFRPYLKLLLKRFVGHQVEALQRLKRGGGAKLVPIDEMQVPAGEDPERAFDRAWLNEIVTTAIERVRTRFASSGRGPQFSAFEEYDLRPQTEQPSYGDLAAKHGVKPGDVRNWLFAAREAVREEIRAELAQVTGDPEELEEEYRALFGE